MAANYSPLGAFHVGMQMHDMQMDRIKRMGLTERQVELSKYWSYYTTCQHDAKTVAWDGRKVMTDLETSAIARSGVLPSGFYDPTGATDELPLMMRKPTASYHCVRVVVNKFTGLLFSDDKHPTIRVANDPKLQTWLEAIVSASRLWIRSSYARTFGGATGSVGVSFRFCDGKPLIEIHDPRWCTPTFKDVATGEIIALEIRYLYPVEERSPKGELRQVWYWYRRIIDANQDVIFRPAPLGEGDQAGVEPAWIPAVQHAHGLGECPAVWIRNTQTNEMDGEPDCLGEYDAQDAIDRLISQADHGAVENADPTLGIVSDELKVGELKKGSRHAVKVEKGGSLQYVEATGSGIDTALKVADSHRRNFLEVVQCVLDTDGTEGPMTATEVERRREPMHQRASLFREQYGEQGVKPLLGKIVRAAIALRRGLQVVDERTGLRTVQTLTLDVEMPQNLTSFSSDRIELVWPPWVTRGATDASAAATAAAAAKSAGVMDTETLVQFLAPYFKVDDPAAVLARVRAESGAGEDAMMADLHAAGGGSGPPPTSGPPVQPPPTMPEQPQAPAEGHGGIPMADDMPGAQVASMLAIVQAVVSKTVPAAAGALMLQVALPRRINAAIAAQMVASAALAPPPPEPAEPAVPGEAPPSGDE
jgi:Phage portal protein, SPP1 Gp6-like